MCSIFGWVGKVPDSHKRHLLENGAIRGRDGYGIKAGINQYRGRVLRETIIRTVIQCDKAVGNFRATPTTELETTTNRLQPYDGIVHNGVISNDKELGDYEIDSMCLADVLRDRDPAKLIDNLSKIKGSYAIGFYTEMIDPNTKHNTLVLACNYKPIYYAHYREGFIFASTPEMLPVPSIKMKPYSALTICCGTGEIKGVMEIPRIQPNKAIVSCSGGLDSVTVAYLLKSQGMDVTLAHFTYGCNAEQRELNGLAQVSEHGNFDIAVIPMPEVMGGTIVNGKYHADGVEGTEYAHDWVSARNLLMLAMLTAYAETNGYGYIAFGGNLEESGAYPDNEQEFGRMFNNLLPYSVQNGIKIELLQPLSTYMKHEIVAMGVKIGVPYELTWSCYGDGQKHCGKCGPCFMRKTAFERNNIKDPVMI